MHNKCLMNQFYLFYSIDRFMWLEPNQTSCKLWFQEEQKKKKINLYIDNKLLKIRDDWSSNESLNRIQRNKILNTRSNQTSQRLNNKTYIIKLTEIAVKNVFGNCDVYLIDALSTKGLTADKENRNAGSWRNPR